MRRKLTCVRAYVGGNWNNSSYCGSRCVNVNNVSANVNANNGGRLSALILNIAGVSLTLEFISELYLKLDCIPWFIAKIHSETPLRPNVALANGRKGFD